MRPSISWPYNGIFTRIQVKYRRKYRGGVTVHLRSVWADAKGPHRRDVDRSHIDLIGIYCPDTDGCYYVRAAGCGQSVTLRISPSRNQQQAAVLLADACRSALDPCDPGR